ncbi:MAG: tetratricopeptide repeat protein [Acidobacteriota bacterium]|nr:tetratricopeptide repeat protein [Acidobacteriota bacterium]
MISHIEVHLRFADHYLRILREAQQLYLQGNEQAQRGLGLFETESANIQQAQSWSAEHAAVNERAAQLCSDYSDIAAHLLDLRLDHRERIRWLEAALAAARQLADRAAEARHLSNLGLTWRKLGEIRRAIPLHEEQLTISREIGDARTEAAALTNLGGLYYALRDARRAIEFHESALAIFQHPNWRRAAASTLNSLALAHAELEQRDQAISYYHQALQINREKGDRRQEADALSNLGNTFFNAGNLRDAIEHYQQALGLFRELSHRHGEGLAQSNLGYCYSELEEYELAVDCLLDALAIARETADRQGEMNALGYLGVTFARLRDFDKAKECCRQQFKLAREINDERGQINALGNLGFAHRGAGKLRQAIRLHRLTLSGCRRLGYRRGEAQAWSNLGNDYHLMGERERAIECYREDLAISQEFGDRRGEARTLHDLSLVLAEMGESKQAMAQARAALQIFEQLGAPDTQAVRQHLSLLETAVEEQESFADHRDELIVADSTRRVESTGAGGVAIGRDASNSIINTGTITINLSSADRRCDIDLAAITLQAERSRRALEPRILPRVPRTIVREQYLPRIRESLAGGLTKVLSIIGPAGYGKSTILGDIYDEVVAAPAGWVGLVRCNDLTALSSSPSTEELAKSMGEAACRISCSVVEIAEQLSASYGRGLILIDTLDLLLNERFVPALRNVLLALNDAAATVVLTCRDYEYNVFLEPPRERLAGLDACLFRHTVPRFNEDEVKAAALGFLKNATQNNPLLGQDGFVQSLLSLAADRRPIREIIENPLLLALLCDLFGGDGRVPSDLTVSRLYARYWDEKISRSRKPGHHSGGVTREKKRLCYQMAALLCDASSRRGRLVLSLSEADLLKEPTVQASLAHEELISEGVLKAQDAGRLSFFHQTFLEYAMALWLTTEAGTETRDKLIQELHQPDSSRQNLHWWPVIRQYLSVVAQEEFADLLPFLNLRTIEAFRIVSQVAAARDDQAVLHSLHKLSFDLGAEFQDLLREAIVDSSKSLTEASWQTLIELAELGDWRVAVKAVQNATNLLRPKTEVSRRLKEIFAVIEKRKPANASPRADERATLIGWFLKALLENGKGYERELLIGLREHYPLLNDAHRADVVSLHLQPLASIDLRRLLIQEAIKYPVGPDLGGPITVLLEACLPDLIGNQEAHLWEDFQAVLQAQLPDGWNIVQARAVGRQALHQGWVADIYRSLIEGDVGYLEQNRIALSEAVRVGAGAIVVALLIATSQQKVIDRRLGAVNELIKSVIDEIDDAQKEALAVWLSPLVQKHPTRLAVSYFLLAENDRETAIKIIGEMPDAPRAKCLKSLIRSAPESLIELLSEQFYHWLSAADVPEAKEALLELLSRRARHDLASLRRLISIARGRSRKLALGAARTLIALADASNTINAQELLPLMQSIFPGVRVGCLQANLKLVLDPLRLTEQDLDLLASAIQSETVPAVVRDYCRLLKAFASTRSHVPAVAVEELCKQALRISATTATDDVNTVRDMLIALHAVAQNAEEQIRGAIINATHAIFLSTDLQKVIDGESEAMNLLTATSRWQVGFLSDLVAECASLPFRNIRALALTIQRVDGRESLLLDRLAEVSCSPEIESLLTRLRGL